MVVATIMTATQSGHLRQLLAGGHFALVVVDEAGFTPGTNHNTVLGDLLKGVIIIPRYRQYCKFRTPVLISDIFTGFTKFVITGLLKNIWKCLMLLKILLYQ